MRKLKVLIACEESQAVTIAFRKLGHEAYSSDIQECSGGYPEWHIKGDVLDILDKGWDLIIAHPPCTYLSNAGACRMYPKKGQIDLERLKKARDAKDFFMRFINAKCKYIAVENPLPMKVVELPTYNQAIQPYMFGDPFSKKTCLWLKNLPLLMPTNVLTVYQPFINGGGGNLHKENYKGKKFAGNSKSRSKTFQGIADAMAEQWSNFILDQEN